MVAIIGYGNTLRGEDGFGIHVIERLEKCNLQDVKLIKCHSLTPELCLELIGYEKIIFVDTTYSKDFHYELACCIEENKDINLSHSISPKVIIELLHNLYATSAQYEIFSILSYEFDKIEDVEAYENCINRVVTYLIN